MEPLTILSEQATAPTLARLAEVPSRFAVTRRLCVEGTPGGPWRLVEEAVDSPWVKDYDRDGGAPTTWARRWDLTHWRLFLATDADGPVGGALVAWDTPEVEMLEGRRDVAVLWDLRVRATRRREGIGRRLFDAAASWAEARGCTRLDVETQDINVPACRFYERMGCTLTSVEPGAYEAFPDETRLLWRRMVRPPARG